MTGSCENVSNTSFKPVLIILTSVILFTLFVFMITYSVSGKTITVDDDGDADHEKIQDAIDNATDGDTVRVHDGYYLENILVNKGINLIGNGSYFTHIDGGGVRDVVKISVDGVTINGFSITGSGSRNGTIRYSGIKIGTDHCRIINNDCSNNFIGIHLSHSINSTLENNICSNYLSGIIISNSMNCTIIHNRCNDNEDAGIDLENSRDCIIENNTCEHNYDGISIRSSSNCAITNNKIKNNKNGISVRGHCDCVIVNNTCTNNGYGIYLSEARYCTCENNMCIDNYNGIFLYHSRNCTIIHNNCSLNKEEGIYLWFCNDCIVENNEGEVEVNNDRGGLSLYLLLELFAVFFVIIMSVIFVYLWMKNDDQESGKRYLK